jgi:hypothetical protein
MYGSRVWVLADVILFGGALRTAASGCGQPPSLHLSFVDKTSISSMAIQASHPTEEGRLRSHLSIFQNGSKLIRRSAFKLCQ